MRVEDVLKILMEAPLDAQVVIEGSDHTYREAEATETTAMKIGRDYWEDHGEVETPQTGKRVVVVRIA